MVIVKIQLPKLEFKNIINKNKFLSEQNKK